MSESAFCIVEHANTCQPFALVNYNFEEPLEDDVQVEPVADRSSALYSQILNALYHFNSFSSANPIKILLSLAAPRASPQFC